MSKSRNESMTSRERMLAAMVNDVPDRVPVAPDFSNMIPCRLTGKPFWEIYLNNNPPLWKAYLDAVRHFGIDGWFIYGHLDLEAKPRCEHKSEIVSRSEDSLTVRNTWSTPAGELMGETLYSRDMPPIPKKRPMDDLVRDFDRYKYLHPEILGYRTDTLEQMRKEVGEDGVVSLSVGLPGFQAWCDTVEGSIETLTYAYYDAPELFEEWRRLEEERILRVLDMHLEARPDFILFGCSGLLTLQSPSLFSELSLPTLKKAMRRCREAGVPTMLHSCGKERYLVEVCATETDLNCINPLEVPPMGDCDLRDVKAEFGDRIALMGNLPTTGVMLHGAPDDVENACLEALDAAKANGGFILSTGDQCGRDTPDENIFRMVEVAEREGRY